MAPDPKTTDLARIEGLIRKIDTLSDATARTSALELVQAIMEFHGAGLERVMEIISAAGDPGYAVFDDFARDQLVASLLLLYGLHPEPLETRVAQALEKVRPYLESHGGNVELLGIVDGVVQLRLEGSCKSCPSSAMTLKLAIEEAIYEAAPDVSAIEAEGVADLSKPTAFVQIGRSQGNGASPRPVDKGWEDVFDVEAFDHRSVRTMEVRGRSILFCRLGESLYAYDSCCPGCGGPLHTAYLEMTSLVCSHCGQRFDVIRAGRGLDQPALHLEPFPLLVEAGRAKVALPPL